MNAETRQPYEWGSVAMWSMSLFLLGLSTARPTTHGSLDRLAFGVLVGIAWAVLGGAVVGVIKYFKRSSKPDASAALATAILNDHVIVGGALVVAAIFVGMAFYLETFGALIDAAIIGALGLGVKSGFGVARWLMAGYAFISPILVIASGGGNSIVWAFVFYAACRSIMAHRHVVRPAGTAKVAENISPRAPSDTCVSNSANSLNPTETDGPIGLEKHIVEGASASLERKDVRNVSLADWLEASVDEERIYATIADELEAGTQDKGLWTRLFAECGGVENQTKVLYIKQRADRLIAAERSRLEQARREHAAEADRIEKFRLQREAETLRITADRIKFKKIRDLAEQHLRNPRMTIDEKTRLLNLAGGSFTWLDGYGRCAATFSGEERQFPTGKEFNSWFIAEIVPFLLSIKETD
ncbi:MAG: hypothetical protein Q8M11_21135 [Sulfuritalea sp.]|nr:hypothetical protein [Sulfuritalea sp.]MDP1982623.1 hypothetical protein [Sulfuritalea sp.]